MSARVSTLVVLAGTAGLAACVGYVVAYALGVLATPAVGTCALERDAIGSFVPVAGGGFIKAAAGLYPEEGRPARVYVSPFLLQAHEVTNEQFSAFVAATGYVTEAERAGGSARFVSADAPQDFRSWWRLDRDATWRTPTGAGSDLVGRERHPVVHVTLGDARSYAAWAGGRIPTEVEWEYAASLGLFDPDDPESGARGPAGEPRANTWDGVFPILDSAADGFAGAAPVGCFEKSLIGAYDMIGNVWEWTETRYGQEGASFTIKGGSYLCASNYCRRYRAAARQGLEADLPTAHVGFRIVKDVAPLSLREAPRRR